MPLTGLFGDLIIELAGQGTAAFGYVNLGAIPPDPRHKVITAHRYPDFTQGLYHGTIVGDFLIPAGQA